ncbi:hypothetical protein GCM10027413_32120 [Conyzicola nivalis]|uniref:FHA domain-containing protein n=1 Tax=Conyzicola nivalis TaxID=1477021 RepID=A0A916SPL7_9MICO|nr:DUF5684 domain-containing protein [Conyzicola nivalis]GGB11580.1 hypothetical protein GCM10010979_27370 [Conyzicola nivalis]
MTSTDAEAVAGLTITIMLLGGLVGAAVYIWYGLALSKLFTKLGAESWRGWVPIVNEMEILARGGVPSWSVVYYFIPVVNLYGLYLKATAVHRINEQLGRGVGSTVLGILVPPVWASILAWGATAPVAGVDAKKVEATRGGGTAPAPSIATGPLGGEPTPSAPRAPFSPLVSDPSGYALPVVQPAAPRPAPAFAPPVAAPQEAAAVRPAPEVPGAASDSASPAAVIVNPWAQQSSTPAAAPRISAPPTIATPPELAPELDFEPDPVVDLGETRVTAAPPVPEPAPDHAQSTLGSGDDDDELDRTVVVDRRPVVRWRLSTDDGFEVDLTASKIVLGRNPSTGELDVEAVAIPDTTRTLSKTHARLDFLDGAWTVTDLGSTNGVLVVDADGAEELIPVNEATPLLARFVLGKVGMALSFEQRS